MSFKAVFITFVVVAALIIVAGGVYLWYQGSLGKGLSIKIELPEEIRVGAPYEAKISVNNESRNVLKEARLILELPEGAVFSGSLPDKVLSTKELGNLGAGSLTQEKFNLLILEGGNTVKELKATVSYLPDVLGSRFEVVESVNFSVAEASASVDISMPQKVFSGEEFEAIISYKNSSSEAIENLNLKINYPPVFTFKSASPKPDSGNNIWELADLKPGSSDEIKVKGSLNGPDESFFELSSSLETNILGKTYTITKKTASISIAPSPLSLSIDLNGKTDFIAKPGSDLNYTLNFVNNTNVALRDAIVKARLMGEMFDLSSIKANASFSSSENALIWNTSNEPALGLISPGASGSVSFSIKLKSEYPLRRLSDKNFMVKVVSEIESPTVPDFVGAKKTVTASTLETKIGGDIKVDAQGFFRDAASGFLNKGPWPPKVNQATNFTIHWVIKNFATDMNKIKLKAFLGNNVKVVADKIKSNASSKPVYNQRTQEIIWEIDRISAGKGVLNASLEAIFQVEVTPSVNQLGSAVPLLQATSFEATDEFTGEVISGSDNEVATDRLDDPTVANDNGRVTQ